MDSSPLGISVGIERVQHVLRVNISHSRKEKILPRFRVGIFANGENRYVTCSQGGDGWEVLRPRICNVCQQLFAATEEPAVHLQ